MRPRKPYHHGHLEETLLKTAIQLIGEVGPAGFTLREVARRAGVSHNAPYRHFADRDELLAAVAAQGFRELTRAMRAAAHEQAKPLDQLKAAGFAYIEVALRRPEHFAVMFDAPVAKRTSSDQADAAKEAFDTLVGIVKACQDKGQLPSGDTLQFALLAWTMSTELPSWQQPNVSRSTPGLRFSSSPTSSLTNHCRLIRRPSRSKARTRNRDLGQSETLFKVRLRRYSRSTRSRSRSSTVFLLAWIECNGTSSRCENRRKPGSEAN